MTGEFIIACLRWHFHVEIVDLKTVKRLISDYTGPECDLNINAFQRPILQYRNISHTDSTRYHLKYVSFQ